MRRFDYSFLADSIPANMMSLSNVIIDLRAKGEFRKQQYPDLYRELQKNAIIESVKGSNAIEGIVTTDDRIRDIVAGAAPITHDELEIAGYRDALNLIHKDHEKLDINEYTILRLHQMIEERTNPDEAGRYKAHDNLIMEYLPDGRRSVRFRPVSAEETPDAMEQLLLAYYEARQNSNVPALLLIPCFIVDFLCIHPFLDGNGRVSRLLTVQLLYMSGYDISRYISIEAQINKYKESYYAALKASSQNWHENRNDYTPFMINFMQLVYQCYKQLDESFVELSLKKVGKAKRIETILMNTLAPVSKKEILKKAPDVSVKTVELVLNRMMKENRIVKIGTYKDARYMRKM